MLQRAIRIAPSIRAAGFARLGEAGANVLVAGTSIFGDPLGVAAAMKRLKAAAIAL
jgi:pentose-5-phosphate-3-epimerase